MIVRPVICQSQSMAACKMNATYAAATAATSGRRRRRTAATSGVPSATHRSTRPTGPSSASVSR